MAADELMTFRSTTAVIVWVVWLLFAAANWIDLAVQGRDKGSVIAAAALLLATGIAYVTAQRPRVVADNAGITVRNPFRDHRVGWPGVTRVDLADVLRVHCDWSEGDGKVISAWAVHYSRRRQLAAEARTRRAARRGASGQSAFGAFGMPYGGGRALPYGSNGYAASSSAEEADAERTVRVLSERATATRTAEPPAGGPEPPVSTWSGMALAAVLIPALILLVVCLV